MRARRRRASHAADESSDRDSVNTPEAPRKGVTMFESTKAFSGFAVDDIDKAREFYEGTLGLRVTEENGLLTLHLAGDRDTVVYPKPDYTPATTPFLTFAVADTDRAVAPPPARGVRFERYDGFEQDEKGILRAPNGPPIAWFT